MLTNKYLKYSPEITLEIFTLICNKLIESGIKIRKYPLEWHWDRFQEAYPNLLIPDGENEFSVWGSTQNKRKTTVQEILGYDPFVKEKDWSKASKEELLEEAKHRYPIGCTYSNADNYGSVYEVENQSFSFIRPGVVYGEMDKGCLFYNYKWADIISLPETKEAFNTQNKLKSIEKWSAGSYVVAINDGHARGKSEDKYKVGFIDVITNKFSDKTTGLKFSSNCCNKSDFQWFATLQEAEMFAKNLIQPVKEEVKQPLKQAVHCTTQEEWDFVSNKIGYKFLTKFELRRNDTINTAQQTCECKSFYERRGEYQLLSFQEWCDLNGYKMEKEIKFKVGDLAWISSKPMNGNGMDLNGKDDGVYRLMDLDSPEFATGHLLENSHFKFKCGKDYFRTNIKNIRHATPEEINNHLISIGEIGEVISIDTSAGVCSPRIGSYDVYGTSGCIAASSIGVHQGHFNPNIEAPRKINWMVGVKETQDEVQLELIDIPKI